MVELNWFEEGCIDILVLIILGYILNIFVEEWYWFNMIFFIILWLGISSIITKLIKGKDVEKSKKKKVWYKQEWIITLFIIVGLVIIVGIYGYYFSDNDDNGMSQYVRDNFERLVTEDLTEMYSYEVINVGHYGEEQNRTSVYLTMKSLGNTDNQAWDGLMSISGYSMMAEFSNITYYSVTILTPTQECYYSIEGSLMRTMDEAVRIDKNWTLKDGSIVDSLTLYSRMKDFFQSSEKCS